MEATKWSQEFIEQRMEQHRRWQNRETHRLLEEAIEDIQNLPMRKPKSGYLFDEVCVN